MTLGTKINLLRSINKMSQQQLAVQLAISQTALSEIESGKTKKIDFFVLGKICKIFNVNFEYFLDEK